MGVFRKSGKGQVAEFTKQLATMINAGIKLTDALSVLTRQISDARLRNTITDIRDRVVTGESFTDGLSDHENYFDIIYVSMVHAYPRLDRSWFSHRCARPSAATWHRGNRNGGCLRQCL